MHDDQKGTIAHWVYAAVFWVFGVLPWVVGVAVIIRHVLGI